MPGRRTKNTRKIPKSRQIIDFEIFFSISSFLNAFFFGTLSCFFLSSIFNDVHVVLEFISLEQKLLTFNILIVLLLQALLLYSDDANLHFINRGCRGS